jgi:hypothetical protein
MDADGACWTLPNPEVRMTANWTMGRRPEKPNGLRTDQREAKPVSPFRPSLAAVPE